MVTKTRSKMRDIYQEYPKTFWILVIVNFIDRLGGSLLFPFFALYLTRRFNIGMTEVGGLFAIFAVSSFIGGFPGGALTDRLGRRGMIIFSLLSTSLSNLLLGFAGSLGMFSIIAFVSGIFSEAGGPAYQAIVADLLPEEKRSQGYGIIRVAFNLAVVFGPIIGGFIAKHSYLALFITDAIISLISAIIVILTIPETKPADKVGVAQESIASSFRGYGRVIKDKAFMTFVAVSTIAWLVYMNMNSTLGVYLRDCHQIAESGYGWILSLNAAMVVFMQFPITKRIEKKPPMLMMALGAGCLAVGFEIYGLTSVYAVFLLAMAIITIGEMVMVPISNALVAGFAPEDMRGRYSFVYGNSWGISFAVGPILAGLIMDNLNPDWLWLFCGILGSVATIGYLALHRTSRINLGQEKLIENS